jgi:ribosomal protein RSM22 (predicted rRNA methylase)
MATLRIDAVPQSVLDAVDDVARQVFRSQDLQGPALAAAVEHVSHAYRRTRGRPHDLRGQGASLCARLRFFLPRDFPKLQAPLAELAQLDALPRRPTLRVLDAGAGLGTTGLAAADFLLHRRRAERVRIDALDDDAQALELARRLGTAWASRTGHGLELTARVLPLTADVGRQLTPPYDLIVLGFVLNEVCEGVPDPVGHALGLLRHLSTLLTGDGALVVLEPALREHSRVLQAVRSELMSQSGPPFVFAPCLHKGPCPLLVRERDWCHERVELALPAALVPIARRAGLRAEDLSYSYLSLLPIPRSLAELRPQSRLLRVVGSPLRSKGKLELSVCGEGVAKLRRLDRHERRSNRALDDAARGTVLSAEAAGDGACLRIDAATQVTVLQAIAPA